MLDRFDLSENTFQFFAEPLPSMARADSPKRAWEEVWERSITLELRAEVDGVIAGKASAREPLVLSMLQRCDARTGEPLAFKLVLSSETDIFFVFESTMEPRHFGLLQESQGLTTVFQEFPALVASLAERCDRAPGAFFAMLLLSGCGERARLDFVQDMSFKFIDLCSLSFAACPDRVVRRAAAARYDAARARAASLQAQLDALSASVKQRNPGLLVQFQQRWGAAAGGGAGGGAAAQGGERERPASPLALPAGTGKRGGMGGGMGAGLGLGGVFGEFGCGLLADEAGAPPAGARRARGAGRGAPAGLGICAFYN